MATENQNQEAPSVVQLRGELRWDQIKHDDILFTYTDGVTDAQSVTGEFFSKERLMEVLAEPAVSAAAFLDRIVDQIQRHIAGVEQYDDLTMLALRRK